MSEKDRHITQLSSENIQMVNEIQDRDEKHQILEEKLEYVDKEISSLGKQLLHSNEHNEKLKDELKKAHARDRIVHELEQKLNSQNDNST
jgi:septal ring factor EnvC (AmiA/AmiB activator)